ncbi:MAG: imidazole glycerol phosphate synthase subunit HisH [Kiritimatiellaeota bacterium]|nr:imidazole glycerol phosphate synthase subunit HisH [Kiritimatiellota bacterium]
MITIIDYKAGNLTSVRLAFEALGAEARITADPAEIRRASRIVFPGVGAAGAAMQTLRAAGLDDVIRERIAAGTPFLGICLGTQILFGRSEEDGGVATLGLLPGEVVKFQQSAISNQQSAIIKIPHMGWNQAHQSRPHPLLDGIPDGSDFYFVHSYHTVPADDALVICRTDYCGVRFASMVGRDNVAATQFHPEKSGAVGLRVLSNFIKWKI